jgi:hypothetical protein
MAGRRCMQAAGLDVGLKNFITDDGIPCSRLRKLSRLKRFAIHHPSTLYWIKTYKQRSAWPIKIYKQCCSCQQISFAFLLIPNCCLFKQPKI